MAQNLGRQKEDLERSIASPFGTNENEMLDLRIKQVRRFEDVQKALNDLSRVVRIPSHKTMTEGKDFSTLSTSKKV